MNRYDLSIFCLINKMKCFFIIYYVNLLIFLSNSTKPKLCINCKFYKNDFIFSNSFGKCSLLVKNNPTDDYDFLVDGIKRRKNPEYYFCSVARTFDNMCGKDGKLYEEKIKKNYFS